LKSRLDGHEPGCACHQVADSGRRSGHQKTLTKKMAAGR
jgi:hypothetical protein